MSAEKLPGKEMWAFRSVVTDPDNNWAFSLYDDPKTAEEDSVDEDGSRRWDPEVRLMKMRVMTPDELRQFAEECYMAGYAESRNWIDDDFRPDCFTDYAKSRGCDGTM